MVRPGGGLLFLVAGEGRAITGFWTNTAGGNWSVPANWSSGALPPAEDEVSITAAGNYIVTLNANATVGGFIVGAGRLSGLVTWDYRTIAAGAAVTVASDAHLLMSSRGNLPRCIDGALTNMGMITFSTYGNQSLGGTFHNLPGALFDVQTVNRSSLKSGDHALLINDGVFRRSVSRSTVCCDVPVVNRVTMEAVTGTLEFTDGFTNELGTIAPAGGTVKMIRLLLLAGALLTGWGRFDADLTNAALVRPSRSNGVLTFRGNYEQTLGGSLQFELSGNTPGVNQSWLNITGAAKLAGSVGARLADAFRPDDGVSFPVMAFASRAGEFTCLKGFLLLGHDLRLLPRYGATDLAIATVTGLDPTNVALSIAFEVAALVCWPAESTGWNLDWSTNLNFANWQMAAGVSNGFVDPEVTREKSYRLLRP